jgi:2-amino-4-hydroxy-6-hydroxymethyldihydropteridine diphosphokinase
MDLHTSKWAYISVGSNLGDPLDNCRRGIDDLCDGKDIVLTARSPFYRTEPVDYVNQEWFINAVIKIVTNLAPHDLLARTRKVQDKFGRKGDAVRFGPRVLDLDIIFYQDLVLESDDLIIPHPRMHKRRFVLQPICDIDPSIVHPVLGSNVQTLLNQVVTQGQDITPCYVY